MVVSPVIIAHRVLWKKVLKKITSYQVTWLKLALFRKQTFRDKQTLVWKVQLNLMTTANKGGTCYQICTTTIATLPKSYIATEMQSCKEKALLQDRHKNSARIKLAGNHQAFGSVLYYGVRLLFWRTPFQLGSMGWQHYVMGAFCGKRHWCSLENRTQREERGLWWNIKQLFKTSAKKLKLGQNLRFQ